MEDICYAQSILETLWKYFGAEIQVKSTGSTKHEILQIFTG